jgi:hypothetical protein
MAAFWIGLLVATVAGLCVLTMLGARRRGLPWVLAALSGLAFPLTWIFWYAEDELPYVRTRTAGR